MKTAILDQLLADRAAKRAVVLATDLASGEGQLLYPSDETSLAGVPSALAEAARAGAITLLREPYTPDHLHGHWLAVISTGDRTRDHAIAADAQARHMLVNVVDDPEHCDFFAAGYVKRGPVSIAVSTGGVSAGFSAALTDRLAGLFGPELEEHVEHYRAWRALVRASLDDAHDRERLWRQLRAAGLYDVLRRDGPEAARALIEARVAEFTATHD